LFFLIQTATSELTHGAVRHAAEHAEHASPHVVNWVTLLAKAMAPSPFSDFLLQFEKVIFSALVISLLAFISITLSRRMKLVPGKGQLMMESMVQALDGFVCGVLGPQGRTYTPFIGSLFIYIFFSNLLGLVPLQNSATAYLTTTPLRPEPPAEEENPNPSNKEPET